MSMTETEDLEDTIRVFHETEMIDWAYQNEVTAMITKMDSVKLKMVTDRLGDDFITKPLEDWTDQDHKNMYVATSFCVDI
jgi:hypothetical protein